MTNTATVVWKASRAASKKGKYMRGTHNSVLRFGILGCLTVAGLALNSAASAECTGQNTCLGTDALQANTTGDGNTAIGYVALYSNTEGSSNTATGSYALHDNTTGYQNIAIGNVALFSNTTGYFNTAVGFGALQSNTTGYRNTAIGLVALIQNTTGHHNTASGNWALYSNTTGSNNAASGAQALFNNSTGNNNTADGVAALYRNTTGRFNSASGHRALYNATTGFRNAAFGYNAGSAITAGSDNIILGGQNQGLAADNGVIRIGNTAYQKKAFVAGIRGVTTGLANATAVFIDGNGQLGTINSSREVKENIKPMGRESDRLLALRPVTFRYKEAHDDGSKPIEFGLIAEEVAEAFPELVVFDANGKPETVRYDLVATLLLNEFQKERGVVAAQAAELARLRLEFARMAEMLDKLDRGRIVASAP